MRFDHIGVLTADRDAACAFARDVQFQDPLDPAPIDIPVELRGRRHLWTKPETSGGFMLQLIEAAPQS
jgi:hypothetical protein